MSDQPQHDQVEGAEGAEDTSLDELNDAGAGAGASSEGSTFEPEEDEA